MGFLYRAYASHADSLKEILHLPRSVYTAAPPVVNGQAGRKQIFISQAFYLIREREIIDMHIEYAAVVENRMQTPAHCIEQELELPIPLQTVHPHTAEFGCTYFVHLTEFKFLITEVQVHCCCVRGALNHSCISRNHHQSNRKKIIFTLCTFTPEL